MAAHGRHEAEVERNQVEHQMMDAFRRHAAQQSTQFEETAQAERRYLANAARAEVESSRQELSQQSAHITLLQAALAQAETRDGAVREDVRYLRSHNESY